MVEFPRIFQIADAKDTFITTTEEATVGTFTSEELYNIGNWEVCRTYYLRRGIYYYGEST